MKKGKRATRALVWGATAIDITAAVQLLYNNLPSDVKSRIHDTVCDQATVRLWEKWGFDAGQTACLSVFLGATFAQWAASKGLEPTSDVYSDAVTRIAECYDLNDLDEGWRDNVFLIMYAALARQSTENDDILRAIVVFREVVEKVNRQTSWLTEQQLPLLIGTIEGLTVEVNRLARSESDLTDEIKDMRAQIACLIDGVDILKEAGHLGSEIDQAVVLFARNQLAESQATLELVKDPVDAEYIRLHELQGNIAMKKLEFTRAEIEFRRASSAAPENISIRERLVDALIFGGKTRAALKEAEDTLSYVGRDIRDRLVLKSLNNLAEAYVGMGKLDIALKIHRQVLRARQKYHSDFLIDILVSRSHIGTILRCKNRLDDALQLHAPLPNQFASLLGSRHYHTLTAKNNLGETLRAAGRLDEAILEHTQVLSIRQVDLGEGHPLTSISKNNLAACYWLKGELDAATQLFRDALHYRTVALGEVHPSVSESRNNLARALQSAGLFPEAVGLYSLALSGYESVLGPDHPTTCHVRHNRLTCLEAISRAEPN